MSAFLSPAALAAQLDATWAPTLDRCGPLTPAEKKADQRQYQAAKALEALIMSGEARTLPDALAQIVVAVGELRYSSAVDDAQDIAEAATDVVQRALLALAEMLDIDLGKLGAGLYLTPGWNVRPLAAAA